MKDALSPEIPLSGLPAIAPDVIEQEIGGEMDNIVPTHGYRMSPMIGIGGSAGSFRGLQAFFEGMPPDSGLVFVVILHLAPDHSSILAEMIQKWTAMRVAQATDGKKAEANCVYGSRLGSSSWCPTTDSSSPISRENRGDA